jgi:hypothetical protein
MGLLELILLILIIALLFGGHRWSGDIGYTPFGILIFIILIILLFRIL